MFVIVEPTIWCLEGCTSLVPHRPALATKQHVVQAFVPNGELL
jgi:hypothetical protein